MIVLREFEGPGVFAKVILTSILKKRMINCFVRVGRLKKKLIFLVNIVCLVLMVYTRFDKMTNSLKPIERPVNVINCF